MNGDSPADHGAVPSVCLMAHRAVFSADRLRTAVCEVVSPQA